MKKKILFVTPALGKGGAETQMMKVAQYYQEQGNEVLIVALRNYSDFKINSEGDNIQVIFLRNWKTSLIKNLTDFYKTIKKYKPDTVIAFMFPAIIAARIMKIFLKYELLSSIRSPVMEKKWHLLFKITSALDDKVIYNSLFSKNVFEKNGLIKKDGIVINNGINLSEHDNKRIDSVGEDRKFVWCTLAHFRPEKDYKTLFKALALIKGHDFIINILGHVSHQTWPYRMIEDLGIKERVRMLGFQYDVTPYLSNADAFVLSTHWEGSPNSLLEAMANYKPIVATDVPAIEYILNESKAGFLSKKCDPNDLAEKMQKVMEMKKGERDVLGRMGRKFVEESYAEDIVMQQWISVLS